MTKGEGRTNHSVSKFSNQQKQQRPKTTVMSAKVIIQTVAVALLASATVFAGEDAVMHWNGVLENAIITGKESPGTQGRVAAIVQSAVYDAVNGIARKYTPLHVLDEAPPGARQEAAAVQAAYTALVSIYPAQKATFDAELAVSVAAIPGSHGKSQSIARGLQWGEWVANQILAWRATDGFTTPATPYVGGNAIGQWRSIPNGGTAAILPQMATLVPFGIQSHDQFRPGPPPALTSAEYAKDLNETKTRGAATGATRSADETLLAQFWAAAGCADENRGARALLSDSSELVDNARVLALINIAFADAIIAGFDCKYTYNLWRPYHAIHFADLDGNPDTDADLSWAPLIPTPNHQEYFSNHSVATGAFMHMLALLFGDNTSYTLTTPSFPGVAYHYGSLSAVADQVKEARILGGIHYRFSCDRGQAAGFAIAEYLLAHILQPVHANN